MAATSPSLVERQDQSGVKFMVHRVGSRSYPIYSTWDHADYANLLDIVRNMEMRSDDVFVTGVPKSGNNWVYEVLSMIRDQTTDYVPRKLVDDFIDLKSPEMFKGLNSDPSPRYIYTHLNPDSMPVQIPEKGTKVIYIVRNFKDVLTSGFHFMRILTSFLPYKGTWEDYLAICLSDDSFAYGTWFEHIRNADAYRKQHPSVPFYVLCYERLKNDTVQEIRRLCQFLGQPDTLAEAIADKVVFHKMAPAVLNGKLKEFTEMTCQPGSTGVMRKGEVGDWKTMFTVAQSEALDEQYGAELPNSPIGEMVRPYM